MSAPLAPFTTTVTVSLVRNQPSSHEMEEVQVAFVYLSENNDNCGIAEIDDNSAVKEGQVQCQTLHELPRRILPF